MAAPDVAVQLGAASRPLACTHTEGRIRIPEGTDPSSCGMVTDIGMMKHVTTIVTVALGMWRALLQLERGLIGDSA